MFQQKLSGIGTAPAQRGKTNEWMVEQGESTGWRGQEKAWDSERATESREALSCGFFTVPLLHLPIFSRALTSYIFADTHNAYEFHVTSQLCCDTGARGGRDPDGFMGRITRIKLTASHPP